MPSLGERLFSCIVDLLFCCGFTLPNKIQVDHYKINYVIWCAIVVLQSLERLILAHREKGIGSTADPGPSAAFDANKTEVLRLLLILLSRQIYIPPSMLLSVPSLYTLHLVQKTSRRDVLTVLCSLLNTAMNSAQSTEISIQSMAGKLPYNHLMFKVEDPRSTLVGICFQVLNVLLDFQSGSARDVVSGSGENEVAAPTTKTNAFRYFLAKLVSGGVHFYIFWLGRSSSRLQHRTQDFAFIVEGVISVFAQEMASVNNLLPGAKKSIPYVVDTGKLAISWTGSLSLTVGAVIFLWKMLELNKVCMLFFTRGNGSRLRQKFRLYVLESDKATDIVAYLLAYFLDIKDKPRKIFCQSYSKRNADIVAEHHGLCRALSYVIQTLSADAAFGRKLSHPVKAQFPVKYTAGGTAADFMVNVRFHFWV